MIVRAPGFWHGRSPAERLLGRALSPLGALYGLLVRKRFGLHAEVPLEKPVVCIGNLTLGGAGKTPVALALAPLLQELGFNPHFLTRGYGGTEKGPLQVAPGRDTAADVGDEALLLVDAAPTWVSAARALGAQMAIDTGADVVVMDDGLQNPSIYKDLALCVIDGGAGFGNGRIFPAGPLREGLAFGLSRVHAAVIVGDDRSGAENALRRLRPDLPVLKARLEPVEGNSDVTQRPVFAFAGIGRPEKFRETLEQAGANIEGWGSFPDHFAYIREDLKELYREAEKKNALIVTTAKDYVRLPASMREKTVVFRVRLVFDDSAAVKDLIRTTLGRRR
jgi:tetraacyldisaccharide 4'-kinase